jgi:hypothetical protein
MAWHKEARFGMFIHWGVYSQAAGSWKGTRIEDSPGKGDLMPTTAILAMHRRPTRIVIADGSFNHRHFRTREDLHVGGADNRLALLGDGIEPSPVLHIKRRCNLPIRGLNSHGGRKQIRRSQGDCSNRDEMLLHLLCLLKVKPLDERERPSLFPDMHTPFNSLPGTVGRIRYSDAYF